jgi:hypothetical protein
VNDPRSDIKKPGGGRWPEYVERTAANGKNLWDVLNQQNRVRDFNITELKSVKISSEQNWYKIIQTFSANQLLLKANKTWN